MTEKKQKDTTKVMDGGCETCRHRDEELHGQHCRPCLAAWPLDAYSGPLWVPRLPEQDAKPQLDGSK